MPMFRTAMVWLGLVDDDEYDGEDEQYYLDEEYDDPADVAPVAATPRVATRPAVTETSQVAVFRGRHARPEAEAPVATVTAAVFGGEGDPDAGDSRSRHGSPRLQRRAGGR